MSGQPQHPFMMPQRAALGRRNPMPAAPAKVQAPKRDEPVFGIKDLFFDGNSSIVLFVTAIVTIIGFILSYFSLSAIGRAKKTQDAPMAARSDLELQVLIAEKKQMVSESLAKAKTMTMASAILTIIGSVCFAITTWLAITDNYTMITRVVGSLFSVACLVVAIGAIWTTRQFNPRDTNPNSNTLKSWAIWLATCSGLAAIAIIIVFHGILFGLIDRF